MPESELDPYVAAAMASILDLDDLPEEFVEVLRRHGARVRRSPSDADAAAALRRLGDVLEAWWWQREARSTGEPGESGEAGA